MSLWPTRNQWQSWSLPSKLTAIGALIGVISLGLYGIEKTFNVLWTKRPILDATQVGSGQSLPPPKIDGNSSKTGLPPSRTGVGEPSQPRQSIVNSPGAIQAGRDVIISANSPRHLSAEQRKVMLPNLAKLKGRPVAFVCRMMDGESCDYATELATFFIEAGCQVPEPIKTSLNDLPGNLAVMSHGKADLEVAQLLVSSFQAAGIPVKIEPIKENSVGAWYQDVVHVIVGRKVP